MTKVDVRPGDVARRLLRGAERAVMATRLAGQAGAELEAWPYASLVLLGCDHDAAPLLLMSDLSEHAKNIAADPRLSVLIDGTGGRVDPLTGPRVTFMGTAEKTADARLRARFLARHPAAGLYADFADFHIYRVTVARAHFVAGFGRIHWIDAAEVGFATAAALAEGEAALVARLNDGGETADRLAKLATGRLASGWCVTGVDPEGLDLRRKGSVARLEFAGPVVDPDAAAAAIDGLLRAGMGRRTK